MGKPNHLGNFEVITDWPEDRESGMPPEEVASCAGEVPPHNQ